ncbi:MAG: FMN-binding domain protein [Clostridia bacterium]|jgi:major membrane immunogen (membrane-anchored lipoprotein)|nr:FMN-binding domain protein [Clostridia bacterium]
MKRLIGVASITVIIIALASGCTQKAAEPTTAEPIIPKDGTYLATGIADQSNWVPEIAVTIDQGKITAVEYDEISPMKKSEYLEYQKSFKQQSKIDLLAVYTTIQNELIKNQDITKINDLAGATKTVENFKSLAASALNNAKDGDKYKDGDYSAIGTMDEKNWTPTVDITVKDGKISKVKYDEISYNIFKNKSQDKAYLAKYKEKNKLDLLDVYAALQKSLIENQSAEKVDATAGATLAHDNFAALAAKAIEQAK